MHSIRKAQSILLTSVLVTGIVAFSFGWIFAKNIRSAGPQVQTEQQDNGQKNFGIANLDEVWDHLQEAYYFGAKLDFQKLNYGAVKGFVEAIADPYTVFMTPEESKDFEDGLEGQLEGIGAELEVKDGKLMVVNALKNSPAEGAGIRSGDIILEIDEKDASEMSFFEAVRSIRGKKGTQVTLLILHENLAEPQQLKITRGDITVESIKLEKLDSDIFHLSLIQFSDHSKKEFDDTVQKLLLERARGLILDIRGNGGGYMEISTDILSEFITGVKPVTLISRRDQSENETIETSGNARLADIPIAVLVNKGSASASEIVAGALQDFKRAVLIGEKTFGKGTVQEIYQLKDGSRLRMTIAKWLTPLGRSINETGLTPDIEVKMTEDDFKAKRDPQLDEAVRYFKKFK